MNDRRLFGPVSTAAVGVLAALAFLPPASATAHGGSVNYRSTVRSIEPPVAGLKVQVLNYDDRLQLINDTQRDVELRGYDGEPYVRLLSDGTVAVNKRSPSHYLNEERFADVEVPPEAKSGAPPKWDTVDETGRFEWHDHRIHFMSKSLPRQVKDKDKRTKVFDWKVPVLVADRRATVRGDLYWIPSSSEGLPRGALVAFAVIVVAAISSVEVVRRRRRQHSGGR
jgi:hypothetical protein